MGELGGSVSGCSSSCTDIRTASVLAQAMGACAGRVRNSATALSLQRLCPGLPLLQLLCISPKGCKGDRTAVPGHPHVPVAALGTHQKMSGEGIMTFPLQTLLSLTTCGFRSACSIWVLSLPGDPSIVFSPRTSQAPPEGVGPTFAMQKTLYQNLADLSVSSLVPAHALLYSFIIYCFMFHWMKQGTACPIPIS